MKGEKSTGSHGEGRYARVIREARKAKGLNQQSLADSLGVSRNTVAGWETGHSRPDLDSLPALCQALGLSFSGFFGVREGLSPGEREMLRVFRALGEGDQQVLLWQAEALVAGRRKQQAGTYASEGLASPGRTMGAGGEGSVSSRKKEASSPGPASGASGAVRRGPVSGKKAGSKSASASELASLRGRVISLYRSDLSAAAGTGFPLEGARGEKVWLLRDGLTAQADEIIPVNGHSMEPTFQDGDEVLVAHADSLREGEIGVFLADGEGYIKEYRRDGLYSHNEDYPPLRFSEGSDVRCVGRVLGKVLPGMRLSEEELAEMEEENR